MKLVLIPAFLVLLNLCSGERILFLASVCSKSHKISFMPVAEALARKGHQVTVVTPHPPTKTIENLREVTVNNIFDGFGVNWFDMQKKNPLDMFDTLLSNFRNIMTLGFDNLMSNQDFMTIYRNRDVDLVVLDAIINEFSLPVIESMNVPFIYFSPAANTPWTTWSMSISTEYATVPGGTDDSTDEMNFMERLKNVLSNELFLFGRKMFVLRKADEHIRKHFPNARPIEILEKEAGLMIMNSHPTTAWNRPLPPNVIPVSALHVRPAKALPQDLQKFADEATHGLIVFTLGSVIPSSSMPREASAAFLQVFSQLPQRVIWKWESELENVPPNVLLVRWLPQQDILAHPNTRLFISHGGLLGIQEAVYHGVPILGLPVGNDQRGNIVKAQKEGYGQLLHWWDVNEQTLNSSVTTMINQTSFKSSALRASKLLRDKMMPAEDIAVYWVEHVLRHGAAHLQLASKNMPLYQYFLIDVFLFIIMALVLCVTFSWLITRHLLRCFCQARKLKTS